MERWSDWTYERWTTDRIAPPGHSVDSYRSYIKARGYLGRKTLAKVKSYIRHIGWPFGYAPSSEEMLWVGSDVACFPYASASVNEQKASQG